MSIIERINNAGLVVKGILALLALLPGVAVFIGLVEIPPSVGKIIYVISIFVSILVILSIILLSDVIQRVRNGPLVIGAVLGLVAGVLCLVAYIPYATGNVVEYTNEKGESLKILAPNPPAPEAIQNMVPHATPGHPTVSEYASALQMADDRTELMRLMVAASWPVMAIMLLLLVASEVFLIGSIVALAWKIAGIGETPAPDAREKRAAGAEKADPGENGKS
jgi:hypothetical protein